MCDLTQRFVIPYPEKCPFVLSRHLPADKGEENLYSLNTVSTRRNNTTVITEFNITPRGERFHGAIAIYLWSKLPWPVLTGTLLWAWIAMYWSECGPPLYTGTSSASATDYFSIIIYIVLSVLVITLTAIAFSWILFDEIAQKKSTPSSVKEQGLLITLNQVSESAEEKIKQQEVEESLNSVDNSSGSKWFCLMKLHKKIYS